MRALVFILVILSFQAIGQDYLVRQHLDTLCGPYMAGRGYVNEGHIKAANYIASEFESYGLRKIGKSWFQEFEIDANTFPGRLELKVGSKKLRNGNDFIPKSFCGPGKGAGKVMILDTMIFSDSARARDFLNERIQKRVLVYHQNDLEKINAMPVEYVDKVYEAAVTIELRKKLTLSYSSRQYKDVVFDVLDSLFSEDAKRLKFRSEPLFQENIKTNNVLGYLPAQKETDSSILITAHYDHIGQFHDAYIPGANDNASGVSMMLDFARKFSQEGNPYPYNIVFIAFGGEESGLLGSRHFVQNPLVDLKQIRFVMNLDLMGNGEGGITIVNGKVFQKETRILTSLNKEKEYLPRIKLRGKAANSDHFYFSEKGIPAFFIYTMGGQPWYHDVYDTPDKLSLAKYDEIIQLISEFFASL